jgi:hypothetical protein
MGASAVVAVTLVRHAQPWPFVAGIALAVVAAAFVVGLLRTPVGTGSGVLAALTVAVWAGITIAVSSWAGDLLHVVLALVAAALLLGLLSNVGRRLFMPNGILGCLGTLAVVVVLAAAGFATYQAVHNLDVHAGHDAGPCALSPTTATVKGAPTTTTTTVTTTTVARADQPAVICITAPDNAAARTVALSAVALLLLILLAAAVAWARRVVHAHLKGKKPVANG